MNSNTSDALWHPKISRKLNSIFICYVVTIFRSMDTYAFQIISVKQSL